VAARINAATAAITSGKRLTISRNGGGNSKQYINPGGYGEYRCGATALNLIDEQIVLAASALLASTTLINTVPLGGGVPEWMEQAMRQYLDIEG